MNTTGILELLYKVAPLIPDGVTDMTDHLTLRARVADLIDENKRLRAALIAWRHADWCESDEGAEIPIEVHEARRLTDAALEGKP